MTVDVQGYLILGNLYRPYDYIESESFNNNPPSPHKYLCVMNYDQNESSSHFGQLPNTPMKVLNINFVTQLVNPCLFSAKPVMCSIPPFEEVA